MDKNLIIEAAGAKDDIYNPPFGITLRPHDDTLLTRGGGKGLKLYDEVERDPHCFAVLQKRKLAVVAYGWEVDPASSGLRDKKIAQEVKKQLEAIGFDTITKDLLDAILKGYAVDEIMWATDGIRIYVDKVKPRDQRRFNFDIDYNLRLKTFANLYPGELMPDKKFIIHSMGAKDGNPNGLGLGSKLFWPVFFKRQDITFWLSFADRFGQPLPVGKYPAGTSEPEQNKLMDSLLNISQEYAVTMPDNSMIEFIEANNTAAGDFYERLAKFMNDEISVCVLGENSTTSGKSSGLGSNQAGVHNEVRLELSRADADLLSDTLNNTLVKWITEFNFPGATPPKVKRIVEKEQDLDTRADRDTKIYDMGFEPTLDYITTTYGEGWVKRDMSTTQPNSKVPGAGSATVIDPAFAENDNPYPDQQALDDVMNALPDAQLAIQMQTLLKPVIDMINKGNDSTDVLGALAEIYPKLDTASLEDLLARLIFTSQLWGRLNANAESN